jgi:hypothetical protein
VARHYRLCVIAALTLVVTSACGARQGAGSQPTLTTGTTTSTTTTTTTTTTSSPTGGESSPPNQDNRCTADLLSGTIEAMDSAAGSRYVTLIVKNKSQQTCSLWGFGSVDLLDLKKQQMPTNAERSLDPQPTLVTLGPGKEAGKILHWSVVATGDEPTAGPCQPPATGIDVTPPDETESFQVDYEFGSVCDHGKFDTSAYFAR